MMIDLANDVAIVTERCTASDVLDRVVSNGHFTEYDALSITHQLLRALEHLDALGIAHRDVKPENLMFEEGTETSSPVVKLLDFGMAVKHDGDEMSLVCGSPSYVSPEILDGAYALTPAQGADLVCGAVEKRPHRVTLRVGLLSEAA